MIQWLYNWLWPTMSADELFGEKPQLIGSDAASVELLLGKFQGQVKDLRAQSEDELKEAMVTHTVEQMTTRGAPPKTLLVLKEPALYAAQLHLRRLLEHRSVAQTWVLLLDATRPTDVQVVNGMCAGKTIQ